MDNEKSRADIIIFEIECGGFAQDELESIIDACEDAIENMK